MTAILDLHDTSLKIWDGDNVFESPGYVWLDGEELRFGLPALRTQRRTPRLVNTRFWSQLGTAPLTPSLGNARHTADLAHRHLMELHSTAGRPSNLLLAISGSFTRDQLSLLLGIVEHLPFSIEGLVHRSALLASASGLSSGTHIELQLHQTIVTSFETEGNEVTTANSQALPGEGLLALQDRLATAIAAIFVAQTRFDPLRSAEAEQKLYDQLPNALDALQTIGEAHLSINGYDTRIKRDDLSATGAAYVNSLYPLLNQNSPVLLEAPLDRLPGLTTSQPQITTDNSAIVVAARQFYEQLHQRPEHLTLQRRVPKNIDAGVETKWLENSGSLTAAPVSALSPRSPSHWLCAGTAKPISTASLSIHGIHISESEHGVVLLDPVPTKLTINGQIAKAGHLFALGDKFADAQGLQAQMIAIEE